VFDATTLEVLKLEPGNQYVMDFKAHHCSGKIVVFSDRQQVNQLCPKLWFDVRQKPMWIAIPRAVLEKGAKDTHFKVPGLLPEASYGKKLIIVEAENESEAMVRVSEVLNQPGLQPTA